ncbi:MAG: hypothetical protein RR280_01195 [Bacteroidaceae bacterium]
MALYYVLQASFKKADLDVNYAFLIITDVEGTENDRRNRICASFYRDKVATHMCKKGYRACPTRISSITHTQYIELQMSLDAKIIEVTNLEPV